MKRCTKVFLITAGVVLAVLVLYVSLKLLGYCRNYVVFPWSAGETVRMLAEDFMCDCVHLVMLMVRIAVFVSYFAIPLLLGWLIFALCTLRREGRRKKLLKLTVAFLVSTVLFFGYYWPRPLYNAQRETAEIYRIEVFQDNTLQLISDVDQAAVGQLLAQYRCHRTLLPSQTHQLLENTINISWMDRLWHGWLVIGAGMDAHVENFGNLSSWFYDVGYRILDPHDTLQPRLLEILHTQP